MFTIFDSEGYCTGYSRQPGTPSVYLTLGETFALKHYGQKYQDGRWLKDFSHEILEKPYSFFMSTAEKLDLILSILCGKNAGIKLDVKPEDFLNSVNPTAVVAAQDGEEWQPGIRMVAGAKIMHNTTEYTVLQSHISQTDWPPNTVPALFKPSASDLTPWQQPAGTHDAYMKNAEVSHNDYIWTSDIDSNVWEPGIYGWSRT